MSGKESKEKESKGNSVLNLQEGAKKKLNMLCRIYKGSEIGNIRSLGMYVHGSEIKNKRTAGKT